MTLRMGVFGGGPWGMALARAARRAGCEVVLLSRRHQDSDLGGIQVTTAIADLAKAKLILVAVPSPKVRDVARLLGDELDGSHMVVHGVRGLSGDELLTISEVLRRETPARQLGALGGPVQAAELSSGKASAMVVASEFARVRETVAMALQSAWLQMHTTDDLKGLEWASALVGCLSIGVGYAQARTDVSPGLLAALISNAAAEAATIASTAGAKSTTFYGLGGYGDLLASMALEDRPEVVLGRALAAGQSLPAAQERARLRVEAIELVPRVARFAHANGVQAPIFQAIGRILEGNSNPEDLLARLLAPTVPNKAT